LKKQKKNRRKW
jgi:hypothetical protein